MNIDILQSNLVELLDSREKVESTANLLGISAATLYRYKSKPRSMPSGLAEQFLSMNNISIGEEPSWMPDEFTSEELIRLKYEEEIAAKEGFRFSVTPYFTVNLELPELTRLTARNLYSSVSEEKMTEYVSYRQLRREIYLQSRYLSKEIINGELYKEFFNKNKAYKGMSTELRDMQVEALVESTLKQECQRRIYFGPDLPIITHYSCGVTLIRVGELTMQVRGNRAEEGISEVFYSYFSNCQIKSKSDVVEFFRDPKFE